MPFGFLDFETPSLCGLLLVLLFLIPDLFAACFDACFDFTVDVREGAIVPACMADGGGWFDDYLFSRNILEEAAASADAGKKSRFWLHVGMKWNGYLFKIGSCTQCPFRAWDLALSSSYSARRSSNRDGKRFKSRLCSMVIIVPSYTVDVNSDSGSLRETLQAMWYHLAAQIPNLLSLQSQIYHAERSVREVHHGSR